MRRCSYSADSMSTFDIIGLSFFVATLYFLVGALTVYFCEDWLKGRTFLWYVAVMVFWPIGTIFGLLLFPWWLLIVIYRDAKKPPKRVYIDPAIRAAAKWLEEHRMTNDK